MAIKKTNGDDEKRRKKLENAYMGQNKGAKPPKDAVLFPSSEANFKNNTGGYKVLIKAPKPSPLASKIKPKPAPAKKPTR